MDKIVSRAGNKLIYTLNILQRKFNLNLINRICLDLGSSHGGFVEVLLLNNVKHVYSVDVAYGILDYKLRKNEKVIVYEKTNLKDLNINWFNENDKELLLNENDLFIKEKLFITCDVSFISVKTVLTVLDNFVRLNSIEFEALILIKPQFEASNLTIKGIITDIKVRKNIIRSVIQKAKSFNYKIEKLIPVKPKGKKGNQEYMMYIKNY